MQQSRKNVRFAMVLILVFFFVLPAMASAFKLGHHGPKHRLGKAFIDLNTSVLSHEAMPMVLHGISLTHQQLLDQGITPDFVVSFRGMNTGVIGKDSAEQVQMMVTQLIDMGIEMEVCINALKLSGMTPEDVLPEIKVIENGWISSILHQNRRSGYAYVTF